MDSAQTRGNYYACVYMLHSNQSIYLPIIHILFRIWQLKDDRDTSIIARHMHVAILQDDVVIEYVHVVILQDDVLNLDTFMW